MNIKTKKEDKVLSVIVGGRIDTNTAPELSEFLKANMPEAHDLVLDLEGVDYVSSAGLRVILFAQKTMSGKGGTMKVAHVNHDIMETFELTGFTDILTII
ncbi:MAG: STAS domain-containing protein [Bacilli bacterium]|nr:STAS domain-containing protein [Bacilli bacterium]